MITSQEKAFDIGLYHNDENPERLAIDLASLAMESEGQTFVRRLGVRENMIVDPQKNNTDVRLQLSERTSLHKQESVAARYIYENIAHCPDGTIGMWWSPPGTIYPRGMVDVFLVGNENGIRELRQYRIVNNFSAQQHLDQFINLSVNSISNFTVFSPEDLRRQALLILPEKYVGQNVWDFLGQYVPCPKAWEKIKSGQADSETEQAIDDATLIAQNQFANVKLSRNDDQFIEIGAKMEGAMVAAGYRIEGKICGGMSNGEIRKKLTTVSSDGEVLFFVKRCPFCGFDIERVEPAGIPVNYECPGCKEKFKGICGKK